MDPPIEPETPHPELIDLSVKTQPESIDLINSKRESEKMIDYRIETAEMVTNDEIIVSERTKIWMIDYRIETAEMVTNDEIIVSERTKIWDSDIKVNSSVVSKCTSN
ncbi:19731_t:CDS:2 [Entrophospora sp. SA101]|nr:19731_t:CDS:2 [Entrophospora sp. SA101]